LNKNDLQKKKYKDNEANLLKKISELEKEKAIL
jgi:hypothetical protein